MLGSIFRPVAKAVGFAAKETLRAAAFGGAATAIAGVGAAATVAGASAFVGMKAWDAMGRAGMGMTRHRVDIPFSRGKLGFNIPTHFNSRTQAFLGMTPLALGGAMGAASAMRSDWDINQAVSTGVVEIEKPQFMGATGSLTLSMYQNRNRRARMQREIDNRSGMFGGLDISEAEKRHLRAAMVEVAV